MPVLKPRTRLVYFRVSEDEFQQFNRACELEGARSLSDLARTAMQRALNGTSANGDSASSGLHKLEDLIGELSSRVELLAALIREQSETERLDAKPAGSLKGRASAESA